MSERWQACYEPNTKTVKTSKKQTKKKRAKKERKLLMS